MIVINQTFAAKMWPKQNPIGKRMTFDVPNVPNPVWQTVIGVVGDVHSGEPSEDPGMQSYQPLFQVPPQAAGLVSARQETPPRSPLVLLAVALFATWVPARRAARVEPVVALRYE